MILNVLLVEIICGIDKCLFVKFGVVVDLGVSDYYFELV